MPLAVLFVALPGPTGKAYVGLQQLGYQIFLSCFIRSADLHSSLYRPHIHNSVTQPP